MFNKYQDKIVDIKLIKKDPLCGLDKTEVKLSIYFENSDDQHHIEFTSETPRVIVAGLFKKFADIILKPAEEYEAKKHIRSGP